MPTATYVQAGTSIDYTPGADVEAGDVIVQEDLVGIAVSDIDSGDLGALTVAGVFDVPKATGSASALAAGATVYWDESSEVATTTSGGNTALGKVVEAATDADETVRLRLSQ